MDVVLLILGVPRPRRLRRVLPLKDLHAGLLVF